MAKIPLTVLQALDSGKTVYPTKEAAATDCSYCRSPCCQLVVGLRDDEHERFEWEWVTLNGKPTRTLKRREDGYCVYYVHGRGCSTYEDKPWVCDFYSCRDDERISRHKKYGPIEPIWP